MISSPVVGEIVRVLGCPDKNGRCFGGPARITKLITLPSTGTKGCSVEFLSGGRIMFVPLEDLRRSGKPGPRVEAAEVNMNPPRLNDTAADLLRQAVYAVEATDFERRVLAQTAGLDLILDGGGMVGVGELDIEDTPSSPVVVTVNFARHAGRVIMFYEATSLIVDYGMVRRWVEAQGFDLSKRSDPTNFSTANIRE